VSEKLELLGLRGRELYRRSFRAACAAGRNRRALMLKPRSSSTTNERAASIDDVTDGHDLIEQCGSSSGENVSSPHMASAFRIAHQPVW